MGVSGNNSIDNFGSKVTITAGVLTNTSTNAVTITESYDASKSYTAAASIESVIIAINGSKAVQISITGGKGNDSLWGDAGNDTLSGGR